VAFPRSPPHATSAGTPYHLVARVRDLVDVEWTDFEESLAVIISTRAQLVLSSHCIGDFVTQKLLEVGICTLGRVPSHIIHRIAAATGAKVAAALTELDSQWPLGSCQLYEEQTIQGAPFEVLTSLRPLDVVKDDKAGYETVNDIDMPDRTGRTGCILLHGPSEHSLAESHRSVVDALNTVLRTMLAPNIVAGGGAIEAHCCCFVHAHSVTAPYEERLAVEKFSESLLEIPRTLIQNGGWESEALLTELMSAHAHGKATFGINVSAGLVGSMSESGVWEPATSKNYAYICATQTACEILSIDSVIDIDAAIV